jgi:hypothetical protein
MEADPPRSGLQIQSEDSSGRELPKSLARDGAARTERLFQ